MTLARYLKFAVLGMLGFARHVVELDRRHSDKSYKSAKNCRKSNVWQKLNIGQISNSTMNEIMLAASKILIPQSLEATVTPVSKKVFVINTPVMWNGVFKHEFRFLKHLHFLIIKDLIATCLKLCT